jgi:ABC-type amino acid transport substrate-binding protein
MGIKSNPQTLRLLKAFDAGKTRIKQNGMLDKILEKWQ